MPLTYDLPAHPPWLWFDSGHLTGDPWNQEGVMIRGALA